MADVPPVRPTSGPGHPGDVRGRYGYSRIQPAQPPVGPILPVPKERLGGMPYGGAPAYTNMAAPTASWYGYGPDVYSRQGRTLGELMYGMY